VVAALWILYKKSYQKTSSFGESIVNMDPRDDVGNSRGSRAPAGKTGPETTSKEPASVPALLAEAELRAPPREERSGTDPRASC